MIRPPRSSPLFPPPPLSRSAPRRPRQLLQRRPADRRDAVAVATLPMQQRRRCLDQPLPDAGRVRVAVSKYRTPDGFQGFVGKPVLAAVEQVAGACEVRPPFFRRHQTSEVRRLLKKDRKSTRLNSS